MFNKLKEFIAPKSFYKRILLMAIPLILQQILLSTYSIIDTIMVSPIPRAVGGVGIASQILSIFLTVNFGIATGCAIFIAQFYGKKDEKNIRASFLLGIIFAIVLMSVASVVIYFNMDMIIAIFTDDVAIAQTCKEYLSIAVWSLIPNGLVFMCTIAYRNIQKTLFPMIMTSVSCVCNVFLNWVLIYGIWFFPELGVEGAAIATITANIISLIFYAFLIYIRKEIFAPRFSDFKTVFKFNFILPVLKKAAPLILNETMFAIGQALYVIFLNDFGPDAYEGYRIAENICQIMYCASIAIAISTQAIIGEALGRKEFDLAKQYGKYFMFVGLIASIIMGGLALIISPFVVYLYGGQSDTTYLLATQILMVFSLRIVLRTFTVILYSSFRAGGESKFVLFLDCGVLWLVGIPLAALFSMVLHIPSIVIFFLLIQLEGVVRIIIGMTRFFSFKWIHNVTELVEK